MSSEILFVLLASLSFIGLCQGLLRTTAPPKRWIWTLLLIGHAVFLQNALVHWTTPTMSRRLAFLYLDILLNCLVNAWFVPAEKLRRSGHGSSDGKVGETRSLVWSLQLMFSFRGPGWLWQVKGVPAGVSKGYPRSRFLVGNLVQYLIDMVIRDLCLGGIGLLNTSSGAMSFGGRRLVGILYFLAARAALNGEYIVTILSWTMTGLADPSECPPFFGAAKDAFTVRRFWGTFYHQKLRHWLQETNSVILRQLRIPRGSLLSAYAQLILGFAASGLYHDVAQAFAYPASLTYTGVFLKIVPWIVAEDLIIAAVRNWRTRGSLSRPCVLIVGYIWVLTWMSFGGMTLMQGGMGAHNTHGLGINTWTWILATRLLR